MEACTAREMLLREADLLSQERIELLMSWRHSGSAHNAVTVPPGDLEGIEGIERLVRYLLRYRGGAGSGSYTSPFPETAEGVSG